MANARFGGKIRRLEGRDGEIARRYFLLSEPQTVIADALGISQQRVSQVLKEIRDETNSRTRESIQAGIAERLDQYRASMAELAEMEGAPVTAGKDGAVVHDPETELVVRDYSARINATRTMLDIESRLAKLYGADEPTRTKTDVTVHGETDSTAALAADLDED